MNDAEERAEVEQDLLARLTAFDEQICELSRRITEVQGQREKIARKLLAPRD
jgi:hypothetical protein